MTSSSSPDHVLGIIAELLKLPAETPWAEFKENNTNPEDIGEYISALSNAAAIHDKTNAYMLWGIQDATLAVVGTNFRLSTTKKGNEDIENWLLRLLNPRLHFRFYEVVYNGHPVVLLEIPRAAGKPTQFQGVEYIRVGSHRKQLKDYPTIEHELWRVFDRTPFESLIAQTNASDREVILSLDCSSYFLLLDKPVPSTDAGILESLDDDALIVKNIAGGWDITNLGAILFANRLSDFKALGRKALRVIVYEGNDRMTAKFERVFTKGYAAGFHGLLEFIGSHVPRNEVIRTALRRDVPMYPLLAVRELVANALIHQEFAVTGAGPMVEIFADRMEISNPGVSLMQTDRFLDCPPRSRNEALASLLRRTGICEERGSGIDKVVREIEASQLPPPLFETPPESTRAVLFAQKPYSKMDRDERVRACYLHACLCHVQPFWA